MGFFSWIRLFFFFPSSFSQTFGPKCAQLQKIDLWFKVFLIAETPLPQCSPPLPHHFFTLPRKGRG